MMRRTAAALGATIMLSACAWSDAGLPASADETTEDARGSDVILNMFQWSWTSVAEECGSTIGPAGFGYVQVSPPQEEIQGTEWWTSYQPVSYRIEGKMGTREEFAEMVQKCDEAGVGVIADAVINHTTGADQGAGTGTAGSSYALDDFPGIYGPEHFNDCREDISDYTDRDNVQNCRLSSLQDLATGSEEVQDTLAAYMNDLLDMGVEGFRIDAAKHMPAEDLAAIKSKLSDPDVYWVQEVIGAAGEPIQPSEYTGTGDVHEFDYGRQLKSAFGGSIAGLDSIAEGKLDSEDAGVFVDNHDTERNGETLNYKDGDTYTLANDFMLAYDYGRPSVYTGYTFEDTDAGAPGSTATEVGDASCGAEEWTCTQRLPEIQGMVSFHNAVAGTEVTDWWDDGDNNIAFGRGEKGFAALNNTEGEVTNTYRSSLPAGTYCNMAAGTDCTETVTVAEGGSFEAVVPAKGAVAIDVEHMAGPATAAR
ncbi:alpha-amylase family protein [Brachybacterium sp. EE-P12]|nr:alpha-amylase family protein [Brachybacterium sp. EE-P12]